MGVANRETIYQLLWAADTFRNTNDPSYDINNYLIANNLFTPNVRDDSGQPDTWRDYQQILPELGLIVSTKAVSEITLTPIALAFIDKSLSFDEMVTIQALRYQYPNGYKSAISAPLRTELAGTEFSSVETLTELHAITGVRIRPAVLLWQILRRLQSHGMRPTISLREIDSFLLPAITHELTETAFNALIRHRNGSDSLSQNVLRTTQEWVRVLCLTPLFEKTGSTGVGITNFGLEVADDVDSICYRLTEPDTFWFPQPHDEKFISWYSFFGSVDVRIGFSGETLISDEQLAEDADDERDYPSNVPNKIDLRQFDSGNLYDGNDDGDSGDLVKAVYNRSLTRGQHILHDRMVAKIAEVCTANGGSVFDDPRSVDLLVQFHEHDYLIEVKSVTPRNFVNRLRLALGQLLHYEYMRLEESDHLTRKVVAFPAKVHGNDWYVPFLNNFLDVDLVSLDENGIRIDSNFALSHQLFTPA